VKEVISGQHNKKGFFRKAAATGVIVTTLAGCGEPPIEEGTVYKKQHSEERIILTPLTIGFSQVQLSNKLPEEWQIYIAQCSKGELPPQDKIEKECKTNSFIVPQEVFNSVQIGQHADFKQTK
jgi:hypothetical protein